MQSDSPVINVRGVNYIVCLRVIAEFFVKRRGCRRDCDCAKCLLNYNGSQDARLL